MQIRIYSRFIESISRIPIGPNPSSEWIGVMRGYAHSQAADMFAAAIVHRHTRRAVLWASSLLGKSKRENNSTQTRQTFNFHIQVLAPSII